MIHLALSLTIFLLPIESLPAGAEVFEQIPAGQKAWQPVGEGKWMPFDGGSHNGGQWLHDPATWKGGGVDSDVCKRY